MELCKFFREGYCRYGSRCRFLHQADNNYSYSYSDNNNYGKYYGDEYNGKSRQHKGYSGGSGNNTNYNYRNENNDQRYKGGNSQNTPNQNAYDLWALLEKELKVLEEGHQWPLTCFCLSREYGNVPGWEDRSPEELRYEMYKAIKEGTFEQCKESISQLYKIAEERRNDFKSRTRGLSIVEALIQHKERFLSNGSSAPSQEQNTNLWQSRGVNQQSNIFGGSSSSAQPTNIFGGSSSVAQPSSIFGGSTTQQTNIFGGSSSAQQSPIQPSILNQSQFGSPAESFSFAMTPEQQQKLNSQNSFMAGAGAVSTPFFQSATATASPFQTEQVAQPLPAAQSNPAFFQSMCPELPPAASASPFGQPVPSTQTFFKSSPDIVNPNEQMNYSPSSDITESELAIFQSKTFKFGQIPLKAPPKELC